MKAEIVTFHRAYNYGAVLQCYALCNYLRTHFKWDVEVLDYDPAYFHNQYYMHQPFSLLHPPVKTWINHFRVRNFLRERCHNFEEFIERELPLSSSRFHNFDEIQNGSFNADLFITGSDQVFNSKCARFDRVYFLDFNGANESNKVSYAASFGFDAVPSELCAEYQRRLSGFAAYSVREASGKSIIKQLCGADAKVCCDPTLLLTSAEWEQLCLSVPHNVDEFILVYYVTLTKSVQKFAAKLSREKHMKVICVPCNMAISVLTGSNDKEFGFEFRPSCSPFEFVNLFREASYVVTNSFHGTVFSVMFQKNFLVQTILDNGGKNDRALWLLNNLNIMNRTLESNQNIDATVDWNEVGNRIRDLRAVGTEYFKAINSGIQMLK